MSSTLAGNLTLLGSIANLIVAEGARRTAPISFVEYLKVGIPVTVVSLIAGILLLSPR
jgi:Na+/H+ antiporter NhaD/arsenite permease-like protein